MLWVTVGCGGQPEGVEVARVGKERLTLDEVNARIPVHLAGQVSAEEKRRLVDGWVEEALLYQEAVRRKLDEEPEVADRAEKAVRNLLIAELLEREFQRDAEVLEGDYHTYYEQHRESFVRDEPEVRARHILVRSRSELDEVRGRLKRGELFDQVAREMSVDASAESGGDLGYFTEGMVSPAFWSACEKARVGRSTVVSTRLGQHIVEVLDRRESGTVRDLLEVRPEIRQRVLAERRHSRRQKLLDALREGGSWSVAADKLGDDIAN